MSSINTVALTKVAAGTSGVTNHQALAGSSSGVAQAGGMANFWDMIISQFGIAGQTDAQIAATATTEAAVTNTTANDVKQTKKGENSLALLQIALSSQTLDDQGNIVLDAETINTAKIERQLDLTNTIINHLKNVLPENAEKDGVMTGILAKLQVKSDTLQASLSALEGGMISKDTPVEDIPLPMLIALGLNPSEITEVSRKIQDMQEKLGREITVEDLIAGVGGLIPTQNNAVVALKTSGSTMSLDAIDENAQPTDDLAAQLNAMDVGAGDTDKDPQAGITNIKSDENSLKKAGGLPVNENLPSDQTLKTDTNVPAKKDAGNIKDHMVNLMNNKTQSGDLAFPATLNAAQSDTALFQPYGIAATSSTTLGTTAQAANMVSSPTVAGQNHPATQLVAATLTKAGKGGEDSTINLRLDPPELGNVAVRLQFNSKDKTVKAIVSAERPETFMMLQRETHALERALQSAGFDGASQSISFELAQDNGTNRRNGENSDNRNFGGGKGAQDAAGAEDIVQSSMTWQVDPSTGRMRYNIMA